MYYQIDTYNGDSVTGLTSTYTDNIDEVVSLINALHDGKHLSVHKLTLSEYEDAIDSFSIFDDE
jgi:hypothetical protein